MIRQTSIDAYHQIKENGLLSKRRFQVYECLYENGPLGQNEVYMKLDLSNLSQHSVSPRFSELIELGIIEEVGERPCEHTGNRVITYSVTGTLPKKFKKKQTLKQKKVELLKDITVLGKKIAFVHKDELLMIYYKVAAL